MNSSTIYDRNLYKTKFKELYNAEKYDFQINENFLSNIINKRKNTSNKFNKFTIFSNKYDYNDRLILRDFRTILKYKDNNNNVNSYECIIWANEENIKRLRKAKYYFIDGTFHHPQEYSQMIIIIMFKDIITNLKIPGIYILLTGKNMVKI